MSRPEAPPQPVIEPDPDASPPILPDLGPEPAADAPSPVAASEDLQPAPEPQRVAPAGTPAPAGAAGTSPYPRRGLLGRAWDGVKSSAEYVFGGFALLVGLAALAAIPVLQLLTLGWLLEVEGRVGRGDRLRDAFPGVRRVARIGSALIGCLLLATPVLVLRSFLQDARLLDPTSQAARALALWTVGVAVPLGGQALLAIGRGGRLRCFFQPIENARWLLGRLIDRPDPRAALRTAREHVVALRLPYYLELGTKGFLAGFLWLAVPSGLLALGSQAPVLALVGVPLLVLVLPWLVIAQARLARERRFGAAFELGAIRRLIARAPLASLVALVLTLGLALPLYFWKIERLPRDAFWLPALFFVALLLPGRLAAGWAARRGSREGRAHLLLRWPCTLVALPAAGSYVFFVFFSQYFAWSGASSLFAHHAFLLPVAFY